MQKQYQRSVLLFKNSIKSEETFKQYTYYLDRFISFFKLKDLDSMVTMDSDQMDTDSDGIGDVCDENPTLTCGSGTIQQGTECIGDNTVLQDALDARIADLTAANDEISVLTMTNAQLVSDNMALQSQVDNLNNMVIPDLEQQIAELTIERDNALSDLSNALLDLVTLQSTLDDTSAALTQALSDLDAANTQITSLQEQLMQAQDDLDVANAIIAELEALLGGGGENQFTVEECQKFQEIADKRISQGKEIPLVLNRI